MQVKQAKAFLKQLGKELVDDGVTDVGAMMAYYAVLALFPMLVFILLLAMLVLDTDTVRQRVNLALGTSPPSVKELVGQRVNNLMTASEAEFAIVGDGLAL